MANRNQLATIKVNENPIRVLKVDGEDYICLTDMAKNFGEDQAIYKLDAQPKYR